MERLAPSTYRPGCISAKVTRMNLVDLAPYLTQQSVGTLREFVRLWAEKKIPDETILFGWHVFSLARLGKLIQLISGSVILLNIIGVERVRAGGVWIGSL